MRRIALIVLTLTLGLGTMAVAETSTFGLGIILGEPTGIGMKTYLSGGNALAFGIAWSVEGDNELHVQGDYLYHNYDLITVEEGEMPLYFGIGGRVKINEDRDDNVGIRFPVGLDYIFDNAPFDIFIEIVPILDVAPDTDFDLNGAIGGRYWF